MSPRTAAPARCWSTSRRACSSPRATYVGPEAIEHRTYHPRTEPQDKRIEEAVALMAQRAAPDHLFRRRRHQFRPGGLRSAARAGESDRLARHVDADGPWRLPGVRPQWLGMVGMHGSFESNNAMHDCDVMLCVGARFDDRVTGRLDAFSPGSKKIHIDIDPSSINKNVRADVPIVADCGKALKALAEGLEPKSRAKQPDLKPWWKQIDAWRARKGFAYPNSKTLIKPQYAIERLYELTKDKRRLHHHGSRPAPDVGGAVLPLRQAQSLDDLRRPRHDGLWPARRHRRAGGAPQRAGHRHRRRRLRADDDAGDVLRHPARPAGEDLHPQQ